METLVLQPSFFTISLYINMKKEPLGVDSVTLYSAVKRKWGVTS